MTYLVLLPCMFAAYVIARRADLDGSYFAITATLLTVVLAATGWFVPGLDSVVAFCLTMCVMSFAQWYVDKELTEAINAGLVELPAPAPANLFCTTQTHDFAATPAEHHKIVALINSANWVELRVVLNELSATERQGLYANADYSAISTDNALQFVTEYPHDINANLIVGHLKLCEAKQYGLVPGVVPGEAAAVAVATAFKHFRKALRLDATDTEALCGLIIAKGCIALKDEQIENSLNELLEVDPGHLHGIIAAARFLIKSPEKANRFVQLVEESKASDAMIAIARLVAHIECGGFNTKGTVDSTVIADLYSQLRVYRQGQQTLGQWQRAISSNIIAYAFERIGDADEAERRLTELDGSISPYPWRRSARLNDRVATLAF